MVYALVMPLLISSLQNLPYSRAIAGGLLAISLASGVTAAIEAGDGLLYNSLAWRTDPVITDLLELVPADATVYGMDSGFLAINLDNPIRMFGGDGDFHRYKCDEIYYPDTQQPVVFTLMNSQMQREQSTADVDAFLREWAAPCGTVEDLYISEFAAVMVVQRYT